MFLQKDQSQVSLTQVGVWFIGEYGEELLESYYDQVRQQQLDAVSEETVLDLLASILNNNSIDSTTKSTDEFIR
jgi:singapore isolate B (sub-type 7) whole genome shotgun sequence assembly, scaffold_4